MDRDPTPHPPLPPEGAPPHDATPDEATRAELLAAVEQASRHLGLEQRERTPRPVLRFDAYREGHRRLWVLGTLLVLSAVAAAVAPLLRPVTQTPADVEADLRWAVDNVAREVEAHRSRTGELPPPELLRPLLGEHVTYEARDGTYLVSAEREGVRVRLDGAPPVEERPTVPAAPEGGLP